MIIRQPPRWLVIGAIAMIPAFGGTALIHYLGWPTWVGVIINSALIAVTLNVVEHTRWYRSLKFSPERLQAIDDLITVAIAKRRQRAIRKGKH